MSAHTARAGVKIARRELRFDPAMGLPLAVMLTSALALAVYVGQKEVREKAARRAPRENAPTARPHPSFLRPRARAVQMGARPAHGLAHQRGGGGRRGAAGLTRRAKPDSIRRRHIDAAGSKCEPEDAQFIENGFDVRSSLVDDRDFLGKRNTLNFWQAR